MASSAYKIHIGLWISWSKGPIFGRTLTLSRENADLAIAFTGVFITFVGARFWRILSLIFHRLLSSSEPQSAIHHQRQALLWNSSSADSAFISLVGLCWAWRRTSVRPLRRLVLLIMTSVLCTAAFVVAGGFSSRLSSLAGTEVLLDGSNCAMIQVPPSGFATLGNEATIGTWVQGSLDSISSFGQQCYSRSSDKSNPGNLCNTFVQAQLPGIWDPAAGCPFDDSLCRSTSENLLLDSGFLDSHADLGINSPPNERILVRNVLHCAPLVTDGESFNITIGNSTYVAFQYGTTPDPWIGDVNNFTHVVADIPTQYGPEKKLGLGLGTTYQLVGRQVMVMNGSIIEEGSLFVPDARLWRPDADVNLLFLSSSGVQSMHNDDPWFRAKMPFGYDAIAAVNNGSEGMNSTLYIPDVAASPMACTNQYQFCAAIPAKCGPLASFYDAATDSATSEAFGEAPTQFLEDFNTTTSGFGNTATLAGAKFEFFVNTLVNYPYPFGVFAGTSLSGVSLLAQETLVDGLQMPLPSNQWQLEVINWWAAVFSGLQTAFVQTASGVNIPDLDGYRMPLETEGAKDMCSNQKILSTAYGSFSVFGLLFIYIVGAIIIILSFAIKPCIRCLHGRRRQYRKLLDDYEHDEGIYRDIEWTTNTTLQLQKFAHENAGVGTWSKCDVDVPILPDASTKMCVLDVTDGGHPRLVIQKSRGQEDDCS